MIAALATIGIEGYRDERMQGVWVDNKKSAALACPSCVGLVAMDLQSITTRPKVGVENLAGCGLTEQTTTSLRENLVLIFTRTDIEKALLENQKNCLNR